MPGLATQAQQSPGTCAERLRFLGQALKAYAADHAGTLPPDLATLYHERYVTCELWAFWCPDDGGGQKLPGTINSGGSYELAAERLGTDGSQPLLRERVARHTRTGGQGNCRCVLLQNGQVVEEADTATLAPAAAPDCPPTVQFAEGSRTEWEPYESVAYEWAGRDDATPAADLEYRTNFSLTGMSAWSKATGVEFGRLRPGDHVLELWVRDARGQTCLTPAYLRFRVRPRNAIRRLEPVVRRMQAFAKVPTDAPSAPQWHDTQSPLQRVDIRTVDPEDGIIQARREGADLTGAYTAADDPGRFQPDQTEFAPLLLECGFPWLHVMLHFRVVPGESRPDFSYDLTWNGRTIGKQRIPTIEGDGRILHLRIHMTTTSEFRVGKYRLGVTVGQQRACDLYFNVVQAAAGEDVAQPVVPGLLDGLRVTADKSHLASGSTFATYPQSRGTLGLATSANSPGG